MAAHTCSWLPTPHSLPTRRPPKSALISSFGYVSGRNASQYQASTSSHACIPAAQSCEGRQLQRRSGQCRISVPAAAPAQNRREQAWRCPAARTTSLHSVSPLALAVLAPAISEAGPRPHRHDHRPSLPPRPHTELPPETAVVGRRIKPRMHAACRCRKDWRLRYSCCTS